MFQVEATSVVAKVLVIDLKHQSNNNREVIDDLKVPPHYSKEEFACRGNQIYDTQVRSPIEAVNTDRIDNRF